MRQDARCFPPLIFFKLLRQLPGDTDWTAGVNAVDNLQRTDNPMRGFKINRCELPSQSSVELALSLSTFDREKSAEVKAICWQARAGKRCQYS
jgi:hypothetical protein